MRSNRAREDGFGGIGNGGTLTLVRSIVRDNSTRYDGGGIINYGAGTLTLIGSVVRGNSARRGGGVWNSGELILTGSTVTGNTARRAGGGIWNDDDPADPGTVTLDATSSVTGNTPDDCVGTPAC